ncbi:WhiB family transcriptional regulator [Rhodococcus hoagii]|nr:WhiB family transcriptional regulator [Prescottella equi]
MGDNDLQNRNLGCKTSPDLFFPEQRETAKAAKALQMCRSCPVRTQCLDLAIRRREKFGIWGGTTPAERERIRRSRTAA